MIDRVRKYLFVCLANRDRSRTAEDLFRQMATEKDLEVEASSAGMSRMARPVTREIADEADLIFVMEPHMKTELHHSYRQNPDKIITLNIPDIYERGNPALVRILREALEPYLVP